jgi:uncharacterized repeat protein (TIGR01451 family)/uncharacterized delta-60 repeat protein
MIMHDFNGRPFRVYLTTLLAVLLGVLIGAPSAQASGGSLDPTFNALGGKPGTTITNFNGSQDAAHGVAIDNQGRIIAAGQAQNGAHSHFALARYTTAGLLDGSFGVALTGKVVTDLLGGNTKDDVGNAVAIDSQQRIVVVGRTNLGGTFDFAVARYTAIGELDLNFNALGTPGYVVTNFGGSLDEAFAVAIDDVDRIVVVGKTNAGGNNDFAVARYTTAGVLDTTFNSTGTLPGTLTTDIVANNSDEAHAVAIDHNLRIVVAGLSGLDIAVARYFADGQPDTSLNNFGKLITDFGLETGCTDSNRADAANAIAIDTNNNIVVAGRADKVEGPNCIGPSRALFAIARYLGTTGELDSSFDANGRKTVEFDSDDRANGLAIDANGRIIVVGKTEDEFDDEQDFAIARLTSAGATDTTFGIGGKVRTSFANINTNNSLSRDEAFAVAIDGNGRFVVVGQSNPDGNFDFAVARYLGIEADLKMEKTRDLATAAGGDTITYTLKVTNLGPDTANNVVVTDSLSANLTYVSCSSTGAGVCGGSGNNRTVTIASLAKDAFETITIKATVNAGLADPTIIPNTGSVTSDTADGITGNNAQSVATTVHKRANLKIEKTGAPSSVIPGEALTYTLTVSNLGPDTAANVVVTDNLPAEVTFVSCNSGGGGVCAGAGNNRTITFASLANGASAVITLQATASASLTNGSSFENTATVASDTPEGDSADNTAKFVITVLNNADVAITKTVAKSNNRQISYTITVSNLGLYTAKGIVVNDPLPTGTVFSSVAPGDFACTTPAVGATGTLRCTLANLASAPASQATKTITLVVKVTVSGNVTISNTATVSTATFDPVSTNNSFSLSTKLSGK